jgi:hypothetical protein
MTDAEIIDLLAGGKAGAKRFAQLCRLAKRRGPVFGRCERCSRLFVSVRCWWLPCGELRPAGFDGLQGRWEGTRPVCVEYVPIEPAPAPPTAR